MPGQGQVRPDGWEAAPDMAHAAPIGGMRKRAELGRGRTFNPDILFAKAGAGAQNRTVDLLITNQLLYP